MVVEPTWLFSANKKTGRRRACEDDGNSAMPTGNISNQGCDPDDAPMAVVAPGRTRERYSTGFCGSYAQAGSGANCPRNIRRTRLAIAVFNSGCGRGNRSASCASWRRSCRAAEDCNWRRLSSTPPSPGKKGGLALGPTKRGKGTKIIALADDPSLPLAVNIESASPHESQLVEGVLGHSFLDTLPARLIGDKAYDSDPLDRDLVERYGIEMIAPHRGERRESTQDGRPLRRYRRRWRVERLFAGLHHFAAWLSAGSTTVENFFAMVRLGCIQILLRQL
jgi:hypothetical protein